MKGFSPQTHTMKNDKLKHGKITGSILGIYFDVYNKLGFGFNAKIYKNAFNSALNQKEIQSKKDQLINVHYYNDHIGQITFDFVIDDKIPILITADNSLMDREVVRLINFLKVSDYQIGLLLNFGENPEYKRRELIN